MKLIEAHNKHFGKHDATKPINTSLEWALSKTKVTFTRGPSKSNKTTECCFKAAKEILNQKFY